MTPKEIIALISKPIDEVVDFFSGEVKNVLKNRLLEYQVEEYKRNYYTKTILHRSEPRKLSDFYQPLYLSKEDKDRKTRVPTESVEQFFKSRKKVTIIGSAGSGKSTIVKYLLTNSIESQFKIPIKIELRYLNGFEGSVYDYVLNEIFLFQDLSYTEDIVKRTLSSDKFLIFFDGYDELNSIKKASTLKEIDEFVTRFPNNYYLITSRPYTNIDLLPLFDNYFVCNLNNTEISEFIRKQLPDSESELADKIIEAIAKKENKQYKSFLSNPLLLSMFILTFQSYSDIPQKRSEFYHQVFDTLFAVHDSVSKLAYVREKMSGLNKEQFETFLRLFSFMSYFNETFIFSNTYIDKLLNTIKENKKTLKYDNEKLKEDLTISIGIWNKEGLDFSFPHRSLQEYFAASYISTISPENKKLVYRKISDNLQKTFTSMVFGKEHFYSLLSELDYVNLNKFVALELLETLLKEIDSTEIDKKTAYEFYGKLFVIYYTFIKSEYYDLSSIDEIFSSKIKYVFFLSDNLKLPEGLEQDDLIDFDKIIESIKKVKLRSDRIRKEYNELLTSIDKSDENIIGLI